MMETTPLHVTFPLPFYMIRPGNELKSLRKKFNDAFINCLKRSEGENFYEEFKIKRLMNCCPNWLSTPWKMHQQNSWEG